MLNLDKKPLWVSIEKKMLSSRHDVNAKFSGIALLFVHCIVVYFLEILPNIFLNQRKTLWLPALAVFPFEIETTNKIMIEDRKYLFVLFKRVAWHFFRCSIGCCVGKPEMIQKFCSICIQSNYSRKNVVNWIYCRVVLVPAAATKPINSNKIYWRIDHDARNDGNLLTD